MTKIILLTNARSLAAPLVAARNARAVAPIGLLADRRGRPLRDLRISVTDRCNFRCVYCMPKDVFGQDYPFLPHAELLTFEEIARLARIFTAHGIEKIRLTGGEPLLRRRIEQLIALLADIGGLELTLTTNGALARQEGARAQVGGTEPRHRQPGRAGRQRFPRDERRRLPGGPRARWHRRSSSGGPLADQDQHGRQARRQRAGNPADGSSIQGQRPYPAFHRVHGRRPHQRLAHGRRRAIRRSDSHHRTRAAARADRSQLCGRGRRALALPADGDSRARSASSPR